jgi:hypothetical protein
MAPDKIYETAVIYKLFDKNDDKLIYIGSTNDFNRRIREHKSKYIMYVNGTYHYVSSFDIIKLNNYDHGILETLNNISRADLLKKETEYIMKLDCLNKQKAFRSPEEKITYDRERKKIYYKNNKAYINQTQNEKFHCNVCNGKYTRAYKSEHEKTQKHIRALQSKLQALEKRVQEIESKVDETKQDQAINIHMVNPIKPIIKIIKIIKRS